MPDNALLPRHMHRRRTGQQNGREFALVAVKQRRPAFDGPARSARRWEGACPRSCDDTGDTHFQCSSTDALTPSRTILPPKLARPAPGWARPPLPRTRGQPRPPSDVERAQAGATKPE
eukprot:10751208-Alexandrium_andersonii.AAC.1